MKPKPLNDEELKDLRIYTTKRWKMYDLNDVDKKAVVQNYKRLLATIKERDQQNDEMLYNIGMNQERVVTACQVALGKLEQTRSGAKAVKWFQYEFKTAIEKLRKADENKIFSLRKGKPTLTGA